MSVSQSTLRNWCVGLALSALASTALAEPIRLIDSSRVRLADLADNVNAELAEVDLGPAPPPGGSRLFAREDLRRELRAQGLDIARIRLPDVVRVQSASRRFSPADIDALVRARLTSALPAGVALKELKIAKGIVASPRITVGETRVPKLARRPGPATLTASVELLRDGEVSARLPVTLIVEVSERAATPPVDKGARIDLVIARGSARISAGGIALEAAEIGEVASFKVSTTQKVLRARVESPTRAIVVTP
jgi:flagella basal body P-ring formation protein FlgA